MVSQIDHFDTIVARSEFEALVLECSLIKRHMPKYNILLKDDKGYPYLRVDLTEDYPTMHGQQNGGGQGQLFWPLRRPFCYAACDRHALPDAEASGLLQAVSA